MKRLYFTFAAMLLGMAPLHASRVAPTAVSATAAAVRTATQREAVATPRVAKSATAAPRAAAVEPGWECSFGSASDFAQFTVIDANGDASPARPFESWGTWNYLFPDGDSPYGPDFPDHCAGYTSDEDEDADDWLITPPIRLQGGHSYKVKFKARAHYSWATERMEVKCGTAATAEAMTATLMAATDIADLQYKDYALQLAPAADGLYYVGFHALSEADNMILYLDDIAVEEAQEGAPPAAVQTLAVTPDATGAMKAAIAFTLPSVAADGSALKAVDGVRITRDDATIGQLTGLAPGQTATFTDINAGPTPGMKTYAVTPYNAQGTGEKATATLWVGLDAPAAPASVQAVLAQGGVALTWDEAEAEHGGVLLADKVGYTVSLMADDGTPLRTVANVTGATSTTVATSLGSGRQTEFQFGVAASNSTGTSLYTLAHKVVTGKAYGVPFRETFAKGGTTYPLWTAEGSGFGFANGYAAMTLGTADDASGDGGCAELTTYYEDRVALLSGKIALAGAAAPVVAFSQKTASATGSIETFVLLPDGRYETVATEQLAGYADAGRWVMRRADLSAYKALDYVRVGVRFCQDEARYKKQTLYIDNLFVGDLPARDLAVSLATPQKVRRGREAQLRVVVANTGAEPSAAYDVMLMEGDTELASQHADAPLEAFASRAFTFGYTPSWLSADGEATLTAVVTSSADADPSNDAATATLAVLAPQQPGATALVAQQAAGGGVSLTWTAPEEMASVLDTFDDYAPWSIDGFGDWTTIDGDGGVTGGYLDAQGVYYDNERTPFAYIVWTPTDYAGLDIAASNPSVRPYSGTNAMASVFSYRRDDATLELTRIDADNWLISPELTGRAQRVSFRVGNYGPDFPESYEVLWSSGGTAAADFTLLASQTATTGTWSEAAFDLPEGARRFAIRHTTRVEENAGGTGFASYPYLLLIDDARFASLGCDLTGYRVYRDGALVATTSTPSYADTAAPADGREHLYQVTALYADGTEATPAAATLVTATAIGGIEADGGSQPRRAYTLDGKALPSSAPLPRGLYVIGGRKVAVK